MPSSAVSQSDRRGHMAQGLTKRTLKGAAWIGGASMVKLGLRVISVAILARLLTPQDYGIVAGAFVALDFAAMIYSLGLAPTLIQRKEVRRDHVATAFFASLFIALLAGAGLWLGAPLVAQLMRIPELAQVLKFLAFLTPLGAFNALCEALLARDMKAKSVALRPVFSFTVAAFFVGIPLAYAGFDYWSLISMQAAEMTLGAAAFAFAARHLLVWPTFSTLAFRELWPMTLGFSITNPLEYISRNADQFFVARLLGANALGFYSRASFAVKNSTSLFNDVARIAMFPAMAQVHDEKDRLGKALLKSLSLIAFLALPVSAFCIVFASEIIRLLLGQRWLAVAAAFALLSASLYPQMSRRSCFAVFQAMGRPYWMISLQLMHVVLLIAGVIWAASHGLTTVCASVLAVWCAMAAVALIAAARAVDISTWELLSVHRRGAVLSGGIALGGWLLRANVTFVGSQIVFLFTLVVLMTCLVLFLPTSPLGLAGIHDRIDERLLLKARLHTMPYRQER
jgi:O-antigen/teichoic acid export membrane protein